MESKFENNTLTIYLEGNVDSNNAETVGAEIDEIRAKYPCELLVLDLEKLVYISSAGLRQILRLKKIQKNFKVINASSEIYEIFDMTGFTEMMDIEKSYRVMNVDGCEVIGEGSNGIVYRINPDTIIKVYKNADALDDIKRERELAKTALVLGINTAIPFDIVKVGNSFGSVFELLSAKSLTKLINSDKNNIDKYMNIFISLLKEIHDTDVKPGLLPDAKQRSIKWCEDIIDKLPEATYNKLHSMLEAIPESNKMIHGDYHTNNVHYDEKEPILIDMDTLSTGNPIFEFSNIYLTYQGFGLASSERVSSFIKIDWDVCAYIWNKSIDLYFDGKSEEYKEIAKKKSMIVGLIRLYRRTMKRESDNVELINICKDKLIQFVDEVDDLIL